MLLVLPTKEDGLKGSHEHATSEEHSHEHDHDHEHLDLDKEVEEALAIINGGEAPMKGIQKLRDVLAADSNHVGAIRQLGFLSMRTNQFEKAIKRFERLLEINPEESQAYFLIGEANEGLGDKRNAIEAFESFVKLTKNEEAKKAVETRIKELSNN
ncbi:tetratricopeptide repeat protein [Flavobacteriales bacterium]|nr:tetratricopeptide repeat protein [Flavobacteriales bacterium]